jgi:hypothetical protein
VTVSVDCSSGSSKRLTTANTVRLQVCEGSTAFVRVSHYGDYGPTGLSFRLRADRAFLSATGRPDFPFGYGPTGLSFRLRADRAFRSATLGVRADRMKRRVAEQLTT